MWDFTLLSFLCGPFKSAILKLSQVPDPYYGAHGLDCRIEGLGLMKLGFKPLRFYGVMV